MRQVRAVLADDAADSRIIETIPRIGYRLKVPVTRVGAQPRRWLPGTSIWLTVAAAAAMIVGALMLRMLQRPPDGADHSTTSRMLYMRGRASLDRATEADVATARRLFGEAARLSPSSPEPHAGTALSYLTHPSARAGISPSEARARAAEAIERATSMEATPPVGRLAAAELELARGNWTTAETQFQRAIEHAPRDAALRQACAVALTLRGRLSDALREAHAARMLDPLSPRMVTTLASTLRFARRHDEALAVAQEALNLDPTYGPALHTLGLCYQALGQVERAIEYYEREGQPTGNLGHAYAVAGRIEDALRLLQHFKARYEKQGTGAGAIAQIYIGLADHDRAFEWLQRQVDSGAQTRLRVAEVCDPLRADPRFDQLLAQLEGAAGR